MGLSVWEPIMGAKKAVPKVSRKKRFERRVYVTNPDQYLA